MYKMIVVSRRFKKKRPDYKTRSTNLKRTNKYCDDRHDKIQ